MATFIELVSIALGSASLFGLIVGLFSVYNGRATRKLIMEEERRAEALIEEGQRTTADIKQILEKNTAIFERISGKAT